MNFGFYFVCKYEMFHNFFGICRGCVSACVCVYCFWFSISDLMYGWICNVRKLIETKNGAWSLRWGSSQKFVWRILIKRDSIFFYELCSKRFVIYAKNIKIYAKMISFMEYMRFLLSDEMWEKDLSRNFFWRVTVNLEEEHILVCYLFRTQMKSMKNICFIVIYY